MGYQGEGDLTVQLGRLVALVGIGSHDHPAGLEGHEEESVVNVLEVDFSHLDVGIGMESCDCSSDARVDG